VPAEVRAATARYEQTRGSLHFPIDVPLPRPSIRRLVTIRLRELGAPLEEAGLAEHSPALTTAAGAPGYCPTRPSIRSLSRSACPLCRAYSSIMCR
jgi:hypothetical protein